MPSIGARGPSREGYLKMRGPSLRLENTSLHRENFSRIYKLHAPAPEHDSHRAIFLRGNVDRPFHRRFLDPVPADLVMQANLREDLRVLGRPFRVRRDLKRREGYALFLKDQDDIRRGTCHHGQERDRKSTRLNSSHVAISYAVFCLKKK